MSPDAVSASEARSELYRIMRQDADFETKATEALKLGERYLNVDNAHVACIDPESEYWEAILSSDEDAYDVGTVLDLQRTFCRHTLEAAASLAIHDAPECGFGDDPAFRAQELHTYHGTTIEVDGAPFGTVCFVAEDPREDPFADHETMFAELVARMFEYELACERYESELRRRAELLDVVNRVLRHNLRNDMNVILGTLETLDRRTESEHAELDTVSETANRLLRLSATARRLDSIVRRETAHERRDLRALAEKTADDVRERREAVTVRVEGTNEGGTPVKPMLRTALAELIENAAKHAAPEPTVRVRVESEPGEARIHVADDGPGLPAQERAVLTEGRETPLVHGSGLGLWMVHWIVTDHGGSISATDTGTGTRISMSLPRTRLDAPDAL